MASYVLPEVLTVGFLNGILDLLFPRRCTFCRKLLDKNGTNVCSTCDKELPFTKNDAEKTGDFFKICISPLYYEGVVRDSVLRFKFKEATGYTKAYGGLMAGCIRGRLAGRYDLITWVPLSEKRRKKRGYDQAMLLAMSVALELDDVAVATLEKHTDVPAQSGVGSDEKRRANISGVYCVPDEELIKGKRILLIDDVVTTGSTLSECARMLLQAGAEEVLCCTLARGRD